MPYVAVLYATREGHTAQIAARVASGLQALGFKAALFNLRDESVAVDLGICDAVVLAASVHAGKHEREMVEFVRRHLARLEEIPNAFLSVTLSEAGVERRSATPEEHARFEADVQFMLDGFLKETGWHPKHVKPLAGALLYTRYNILIRFIMKQIARKSGGDTDTSRDFDYTDWADLDAFVRDLAKDFSVGNSAPFLAVNL